MHTLQQSVAPHPNILWIQADELRADALGAYSSPVNWPKPFTPAINRLADSGVVFENTFCQSPVCVPSRTSLVLGRYPLETGVLDNHSLAKPTTSLAELPNLMTILAAAGYATRTFGKQHLTGVGGWHVETEVDLDPHSGYARYFPPNPVVNGTADSVRLSGGPRVIIGGTYPEGETTPTTELTDLALDWLRTSANSSAPWFTHVSYLAPHTPVLAPAEFRSMFDDDDFAEAPNGFEGAGLSAYERSVSVIQGSDELTRREVATARASYWACVAHLDNEIGRLIDELEARGLRESTIVILDADHGTMLGEHGMWQKHVFNRASHRVPLIISAPGHREPGRRDDINELVDRVRTVQGLAGIEGGSDIGGRDLFHDAAPAHVFGAIGGGELGSMLYPLAGGQHEAPQRLCVRSDRYRLDLSTRFRGQDIAPDSDAADIFVADVFDDPLEQRNIAAEIPRAALDELLDALRVWRSTCAQRGPGKERRP